MLVFFAVQKNLRDTYPKIITVPVQSYYVLNDLGLDPLAKNFISPEKNVSLIVVSHPRFVHTKDSVAFIRKLESMTEAAWKTVGLEGSDLTWVMSGVASAEVENKNNLQIVNILIMAGSLPLAFLVLALGLSCPTFIIIVLLGFPASTFVSFLVMHFVSSSLETPSFTPLVLMIIGLILEMANSTIFCKDFLRARKSGASPFMSMKYSLQSAGIVAFTTGLVLCVMFLALSFLHYTPYLAVSIAGMVCSIIASASSITLTPALLLCLGDSLLDLNDKIERKVTALSNNVKKMVGMPIKEAQEESNVPEEKSLEMVESKEGQDEYRTSPEDKSPRDLESFEVAVSKTRPIFPPEEGERMTKNRFWGAVGKTLSYPKRRQLLVVGLGLLPLLIISIFAFYLKGTARVTFLLPAKGTNLEILNLGAEAFKSKSYLYRYRIIFTVDDPKYYPNGIMSEEAFAVSQGAYLELASKVPKFNIKQIISPLLLDGQMIPYSAYLDPAQSTGITTLGFLKGNFIGTNGKSIQSMAYPDVSPDSEEGRAWTRLARKVLKEYGEKNHMNIYLEGFGCATLDTLNKAIKTVPILGVFACVAIFFITSVTLYNFMAGLLTSISLGLSIATAYGFASLIYRFGILQWTGLSIFAKLGEVHWIPILICLPGMVALGLSSSLYMSVKAIESHKEGASDEEASRRYVTGHENFCACLHCWIKI